MLITIFRWCFCPTQVSTALTQCRFNAGPPLPALASIHSTPGSASWWQQWVQSDIDPKSVNCFASIAGADQHPFNTVWPVNRRRFPNTASMHRTDWEVYWYNREHEVWPDAGLVLARRLWRWLNINPALVNHGAGMLSAVAHILHCLALSPKIGRDTKPMSS